LVNMETSCLGWTQYHGSINLPMDNTQPPVQLCAWRSQTAARVHFERLDQLDKTTRQAGSDGSVYAIPDPSWTISILTSSSQDYDVNTTWDSIWAHTLCPHTLPMAGFLGSTVGEADLMSIPWLAGHFWVWWRDIQDFHTPHICTQGHTLNTSLPFKSALGPPWTCRGFTRTFRQFLLPF